MKRDETEFKVLEAFQGDAILIKTFNENNEEFIILVDGGTPSTFEFSLRKELKDIEKIDLLVLTHIDSDHIGGLINFLRNSLISKITINEIWLNHPDLIDASSGDNLISFKQANSFLDLIREKCPQSKVLSITTCNGNIIKGTIEIKILSPTKEIVLDLYKKWPQFKEQKAINVPISSKSSDTSTAESLFNISKTAFLPEKNIQHDLINASSIAFLIKCPDTSLLLLADSRAELIEKELRDTWHFTKESPLICDYVKISHHGSKNNTSNELMELIKCTKFIISTNGGNSSSHPSRETIARIVYASNRDINTETVEFFTNYPIDTIEKRRGVFVLNEDLISGNWTLKHKNLFKK